MVITMRAEVSSRQGFRSGGVVMEHPENMQTIIGDLIGVMHMQAKELEKLVEHVQQVAGRLGYQHQFSVIASELSELHVRALKLTPPKGAKP
jgi:hypothetical protein